MAGHRMAGVGAAALAAAVILSGCSFGGAVRQAPNPTTGRPPVELTRMDASAVAIYNAAAPYNAGTAGASAQDQIGRGNNAGNGVQTAPGGTGPGTGTGMGGTVQPRAGNTGGGAGMRTTPGTGAGNAPAGTRAGTGPGGTTGAGTAGTGSAGTGAGMAPGASTATPPATGANPGGTAATGSATGTAGGTAAPGTATGTAGGTAATGTATGTTASPGVTSRITPSTGAAVDWIRIQGDFRTLTAMWGSARGMVKGQGANANLLAAVDDAVSRLGTAIAGRNALGTAMAANDLTAYTTTLLGLYRPGTPVQIYEMEYLAREVELDTESGNTEGALDAARSVGGTWASLRPVAMARNRAHASAVDADVGRLASDVASGANLNLRSDAATLLRDLQTLTRDFLTATR